VEEGRGHEVSKEVGLDFFGDGKPLLILDFRDVALAVLYFPCFFLSPEQLVLFGAVDGEFVEYIGLTLASWGSRVIG
jgi:hypothetical protein